MRILGPDWDAIRTAVIRRDREDKLRKTYARIEELIVEYSVDYIVLGCPLNMDDSEGDRVVKTYAFKEALERRTGLRVELMDERLKVRG